MPLSRARGYALLVLVLALPSACRDEDANDDAAPDLLPGSVIVASKSTFQSGGLATFGPADLSLSADGDVALLLFAGSTTFFDHSLTVLISDPATVGAYYDSVTSAAGSLSDGGYQLALSHDHGATWAVHPVPGAVGGVRFVGQRLFLVLLFFQKDDRGSTWTEFEIHEFFPDTDQLGPLIGRRFGQGREFRRVEFAGNLATAYQVNTDQSADLANGPDLYPDAGAGTIDWIRIDVLTGEVLSKQLRFSNTQGKDIVGVYVSPDGGQSYRVFGKSPYGGFRRSCIGSVDLSFAPYEGGPNVLPSARCWPAVEVPPTSFNLAITNAGAVQLWWEKGEDGDEAWAMRMVDGKPDVVFLGPGRPIGWLPWGAVHAHSGGLVEVRVDVPSRDNNPYTTRYVRVPSSGPALEVPLVPAGDLPGTILGYVPSLAAQFRDGSWLTVHTTRTYRDPKYAVGPIGWVFVRHENHGPEVPIPPRTRTRRFPGCLIEPTPQTAIDEACIRYASTCGEYIQGFQLYGCVRDLLAATPEARAAFLATTPACGGEWWTVAPASVPADPNCSPVGEASCDGDTLIQCFGTIREFDCAAAGLTCQPDPVSDDVPYKTHINVLGVENGAACGYTNCPRPDLTGVGGWCAGTWAFFPISDATDRAVDCRALGYDTCVEGPKYPYCTGTPPPPPVIPDATAAGPFERACGRAVACGLQPDVMAGDGFGRCLQNLMSGGGPASDDAHDAWFTAFIAATNCDTLEALLADRFKPAAYPPECAGVTGAACSASGGICYSKDTFSEDGYTDCPAFGLACHDAGGGSFSCGMAVPGCVGNENENRCVGTAEVDCIGANVGMPINHCERLPGFACSASGGCEALTPSPEYCEGAGAPSCDGSVLRYCYLGSSRALDCALVGAVCSAPGGHAACALP